MEQQAGVQSLERAFALLEALSMHPGGAGLLELSGATGLHKSTAHRLLNSMGALGYIDRSADGKYRLTYKLMELSGRLEEGRDALAAARSATDALRDRVGETVHLVVREGAQIVYVHKAECLWLPYRMASRVGMRRNMHCTAAGKAILSMLPESEVRDIWARTPVEATTPFTITTLPMLLRELEQIRAQGYALDNQENELDVRCIAGALTEHGAPCNAAFSISAPLVRMTDERINELVPEVLAVRQQVGR